MCLITSCYNIDDGLKENSCTLVHGKHNSCVQLVVMQDS